MSSKNIYKETYRNEYEELVIKMATSAYLNELGESIEKKKLELINLEDNSIPEESINKLKKELKNMKKRKRLSYLQRSKIFNKRIAVFIGLSTIIIIGGTTTLEAFRLNIVNLFISATEKYTNISLTNDVLNSAPDLSEEWKGYYSPHYIPDGFDILKSTINEGIGEIIYTNNDSEKIMFAFSSTNQNLFLDTEDVTYKEIMINDSPGQIIQKNNCYTIIFRNNEYFFTISGDIPIKELVKIAENTKKQE